MEEQDLTQQLREFVSALRQYLQQQGRELVGQVLVEPLRQAAVNVVILLLLGTLVGLALVFLGIGAVLGLAEALGSNYALAFVLIGLALLLIAGLVHLARRPARASGEAENDQGQQ